MKGWLQRRAIAIPGLPPGVLPPLLVLLGLASIAHHVDPLADALSIAPVVGAASVFVVTAGVLTMVAALTGSSALRRAVSWSLLLLLIATLLASLGGARQPTWFAPHPAWHQSNAALTSSLLVTASVALVGLLDRRTWARWLALGLAGAGLLHATFEVGASWAAADARLWISSLQGGGCLLLMVGLAHPGVRDGDEPPIHETIWGSGLAEIRWLRAAIVCSIGATPALLAYGWAQPASIRMLEGPAILFAASLALGILVTLRGKTVGVVLLGLAGLGLLALAGLLVAAGTTALDHRIAAFHGCFWLPAAISNIVAAILVIRRHHSC